MNLFQYDAELGGDVFNLGTSGLTAGVYALNISWSLDGVYTEQEFGFRLI